MRITKIKNRILMLSNDYLNLGWDLNLYVIHGDKYNFVIDTGLGSFHADDMLRHLDSTKKTIVVNTHHHWDHIWGNCSFKKESIISHTLCREKIVRHWDTMMSENKRFVLGLAEMTLPSVTFDSEMCFDCDGVRLIYTPGHSEDCISILDSKEGVLIAGDNIGDDMDNIVPYLECPEMYDRTLNIYASLDYDTVLSGHNKPLARGAIDTIRKIHNAKKG